MQFRNLLYNRKSKSRPAGIAAPRLLCPVKFLENMIQFLFWNDPSVVNDTRDHIFALFFH